MKYGFTIIELIVVITIMLTFMGVGFLSFNTISANALLNKHTQILADYIQGAKERAQQRFIDPSHTTCVSLKFHEVWFLAPSRYMIGEECVGTTTYVQFTDLTLPANIKIGETSDGPGTTNRTSLQFTPPYGKTNFSTDYNISIKNSVTNRCNRISVSPLGKYTITEGVTCW